MNKLTISLFFAGLFSLSHAQAGSWDYDDHSYHEVDVGWVERRQDRQHHRIEEGVTNGQLTKREEKELWRQHHKIVELASCYINDGWLSRKEKIKLSHRFERASDLIYRLKHNHRNRRHYHSHAHYSDVKAYRRGYQQDNNKFSISLAGVRGGSDFYLSW